MSAYNGAVGVAKEPGLVSPDYLVLRPRVAACPEYLGYLIKSHWFVGEMTSRLRGIGSADNAGVRTPRIGLGELNSIEVREVSFDEQRSIVRYLDRETAEIDEFVAESEKLITLLNERRAAVTDVTFSGRVGEGVRLRALFREIDIRAGGNWTDVPLLSVSITWGSSSPRRGDRGSSLGRRPLQLQDVSAGRCSSQSDACFPRRSGSLPVNRGW